MSSENVAGRRNLRLEGSSLVERTRRLQPQIPHLRGVARRPSRPRSINCDTHSSAGRASNGRAGGGPPRRQVHRSLSAGALRRITVRTKDGRTLVKEHIGYEGGLDQPMSWDRVVEKFHWLSERFADENLRSKLIGTVQQLDAQPISALMDLLAPGSTDRGVSENSCRNLVNLAGRPDLEERFLCQNRQRANGKPRKNQCASSARPSGVPSNPVRRH